MSLNKQLRYLNKFIHEKKYKKLLDALKIQTNREIPKSIINVRSKQINNMLLSQSEKDLGNNKVKIIEHKINIIPTDTHLAADFSSYKDTFTIKVWVKGGKSEGEIVDGSVFSMFGTLKHYLERLKEDQKDVYEELKKKSMKNKDAIESTSCTSCRDLVRQALETIELLFKLVIYPITSVIVNHNEFVVDCINILNNIIGFNLFILYCGPEDKGYSGITMPEFNPTQVIPDERIYTCGRAISHRESPYYSILVFNTTSINDDNENIDLELRPEKNFLDKTDTSPIYSFEYRGEGIIKMKIKVFKL
jgi:hypothetical protein